MNLVSVILPVFALIAIGAAARRFRLVEPPGFRGLADIVFFLAMPAMLFRAIQASDLSGLLGIAGFYFVAGLVVFAIGLLAGWALGLPLPRSAMLGLNGSYGNTVMVGIPIIGAALGAQALPPLMAIISLQSVILLPLAGVLVGMGGGGRSNPAAIVATTLKTTLRHPIIMSIAVACLWRTLALPVPAPLAELLRLLGAAAVPLALICLGGSLPAPKPGALGMDAILGIVLKLAVLPALVWLIGRWAGLAPLPLAVAVVTGGMPTGANAFLLVRHAEKLVEISAATVVATTLLSLASLYVLLWMVT